MDTRGLLWLRTPRPTERAHERINWVRRIPIDLVVAVAVIVAISVWESLQCWEPMIGCNQPWRVGWSTYLGLLGALLAGPFSGVILPLCYSGVSAESLRGITFTTPFIIVAIVPWIAWALTRSPIALAAGVLLWISTGFLFCIAIWI